MLSQRTQKIIDALKTNPEIFQEIKKYFWALEKPITDPQPRTEATKLFHLESVPGQKGYVLRVRGTDDNIHNQIWFSDTDWISHSQANGIAISWPDSYGVRHAILEQILEPFGISPDTIVMPWDPINEIYRRYNLKSNLIAQYNQTNGSYRIYLLDGTIKTGQGNSPAFPPKNNLAEIDKELIAAGHILFG